MGGGTSREDAADGDEQEEWGARGIQGATFRHGSLAALDEALFEAVADGDDEATARLLEEGANVNHLSADHDWASPVIVAAQEGSLECLKLLLAAPHVECDRADKFGFTACHMACHWCAASRDLRPESGRSIPASAHRNSAGCLQALLEAGAQPALLAPDAGTPAHVAAARDHDVCLHMLLVTAGVSPDCPNGDGRGVYDVAVEHSSHRCVARLDALEDLRVHDGGSTSSTRRRPQLTGEHEALRAVAEPQEAV